MNKQIIDNSIDDSSIHADSAYFIDSVSLLDAEFLLRFTRIYGSAVRH